MRYPNVDRARRHLLRSQTAYRSSLYRHFPQRIVLGIDADADVSAFERPWLNKRIIQVEPMTVTFMDGTEVAVPGSP